MGNLKENHMNSRLTKVGATVGLLVAISHGVIVENPPLKPQIERAPAPFTMPETHQRRAQFPPYLGGGTIVATPSGTSAGTFLQTFPDDAMMRIILGNSQPKK